MQQSNHVFKTDLSMFAQPIFKKEVRLHHSLASPSSQNSDLMSRYGNFNDALTSQNNALKNEQMYGGGSMQQQQSFMLQDQMIQNQKQMSADQMAQNEDYDQNESVMSRPENGLQREAAVRNLPVNRGENLFQSQQMLQESPALRNPSTTYSIYMTPYNPSSSSQSPSSSSASSSSLDMSNLLPNFDQAPRDSIMHITAPIEPQTYLSSPVIIPKPILKTTIIQPSFGTPKVVRVIRKNCRPLIQKIPIHAGAIAGGQDLPTFNPDTIQLANNINNFQNQPAFRIHHPMNSVSSQPIFHLPNGLRALSNQQTMQFSHAFNQIPTNQPTCKMSSSVNPINHQNYEMPNVMPRNEAPCSLHSNHQNAPSNSFQLPNNQPHFQLAATVSNVQGNGNFMANNVNDFHSSSATPEHTSEAITTCRSSTIPQSHAAIALSQMSSIC